MKVCYVCRALVICRVLLAGLISTLLQHVQSDMRHDPDCKQLKLHSNDIGAYTRNMKLRCCMNRIGCYGFDPVVPPPLAMFIKLDNMHVVKKSTFRVSVYTIV